MGEFGPDAVLLEDGSFLLIEQADRPIALDATAADGPGVPALPAIALEGTGLEGSRLGLQTNDGAVLNQGQTAYATLTAPQFDDRAVFPEEIGAQSKCTITFGTQVQELRDGSEVRMVRRTRPLLVFRINKALRTYAEISSAKAFHRARGGSERGFRFRDPFDWSTHPDHVGVPSSSDPSHRVVIGSYEGTGDDFQLVKRYQFGDIERLRPITRPTWPASAPYGHEFFLFYDGVLQTEGSTYRLDRDGGVVTLIGSKPAAGTVIEWAGTFMVPVHFGADTDVLLNTDYATVVSNTAFTIVELAEGVPFHDGKQALGASIVDLTGRSVLARSHAVQWSDGWFQEILHDNPQPMQVFLPRLDPQDVAQRAGGPILHLANSSSSSTICTVLSHGNDTVVVTSLAAGAHVELWADSSGGWLAK